MNSKRRVKNIVSVLSCMALIIAMFLSITIVLYDNHGMVIDTPIDNTYKYMV